MKGPQGIRVAIGTNALGKPRAGHDITAKLQAVKKYGYDGIEVAIECLEAHSQISDFATLGSRGDRLRAAAADIHRQAAALGLEVVALNPFMAYDGLGKEVDVASRLEEAELWLQICVELHCPILQIASCIYPLQKTKSLTSDPRLIAKNMRRLSELAQKYDKILAFEGVAWGIHTNTWQQVHEIMGYARHPNIRHCMDTFHVAAVEAGDPFNSARPIRPDGRERLDSSLGQMRKTLRPSDIGYFQLSDAIPADKLQQGYPVQDLEQPPFMTQSRNCRVFPGEGVLPVLPVAKAVFDIGYRGWVSMEVFHPSLWDQDKSTPDDWARRGMESWDRVSKYCFGSNPRSQL